jgi:DNA-binding NarL/FixJ family response regulator
MTNSSTSRLLLCVDNDVDSCAAFKARLKTYRVVEAHAADTGMRLARRFPFDVYLVNAELPDGGAVEFCDAVCRIDPKAPVIAYNAPEEYEACSTLLMIGMKIYLVGPSSTASLTAMLASAIEGRRVESLPARIAEHAAVQDELQDRSAAVGVRLQSSWRQSQDSRARLARGKAYKAFASAGGSRANFMRIWAGMVDSLRIKM